MRDVGPEADRGEWITSSGGIRYRLEGAGAVVALPEGHAMVAEAERLLYSSEGVRWSVRTADHGRVRDWVNRIQRRAAGLAGRMSRFEGPGEVGFAAGEAARIHALELRRGDNMVVGARSLLAAAATVQVDVALVEKIREDRERRTTVMYRLIGEGFVLLAAFGAGVVVELGAEEAIDAAPWGVAWYDATGGYQLRRVGGRRGDHVVRITGPTRLVLQTARP